MLLQTKTHYHDNNKRPLMAEENTESMANTDNNNQPIQNHGNAHIYIHILCVYSSQFFIYFCYYHIYIVIAQVQNPN